MADPIKVALKHPIERKDDAGNVVATIAEVTLRRPKGKQMRAMDNAKGAMGRTLALIAVCGGLLPMEADELDGEDILALGERIADFLGQSLPTGDP